MSISTRTLPGTTVDPLYPDSDGEPMGEGAFHLAAFLHLYTVLSRFFEHRHDIYVAGDMFLYYDQNNPDAKKAPDVMVAKGVVGNHPRRSFRTWEEGVVPAVVFEVLSRKTLNLDLNEKKLEYAQIGIAEYFIFDPEGLVKGSPFQGFRLQGALYAPLAFDVAGRMASSELGLNFDVDEPLLRVIDPQTNRRLMTDRELEEAAENAIRRAVALEAELRRLRRTLGESST